MRAFLLALQFLTRLPVRVSGSLRPEEPLASLVFFPLVGGLLGGVQYLVYRAGSAAWAGVIPGILAAGVEFILTGGLHWDGLADLADGWYSGREREKRLMVMRDSRVGAMGAAVLGLHLLLKVSLLSQVGGSLYLMVSGGAWAKLVMVLGIALFPYARSTGAGGPFRGAGWKQVLPAAGLTLVPMFWLNPTAGLSAILAGAVILLFAAYISRGLGGLTGDVYGALHELYLDGFWLLAGRLG